MAAGAVGRVDLFVLDVEGAEQTILYSLSWSDLDIPTFLIEDNKLYGRRLDYDMNMRGYIKHHQLAIDGLFVRRDTWGHHSDMTSQIWYPKAWKSYEDLCELQGTCRDDCPAGKKMRMQLLKLSLFNNSLVTRTVSTGMSLLEKSSRFPQFCREAGKKANTTESI